MKNRIPIILLVLVHLPLLIGYLVQLPQSPAWYFGPLAWIALGVLFVLRNGGRREIEPQEDGNQPAFCTFVKFRVVLSVLLILTALVSQQFGFGIMSGLVWLHAWLQRHRDRMVESSLAYLTAIGFFATYVDIRPVNWLLGRITAAGTSFASRVLDQLGYLHLRANNVIEVSGQAFSADVFCNGFFSVPAFVCCAVIVLCVQRRKWGHFLPSLLVSSVFAVVLQVGILCTCVIAWTDYQTAFDSGTQRLLMTGGVFGITLLCFASFDVLLSFFTDPVSFMGAGSINPVSLMWNRMFLKLPREEPGATEDVGMPDWDTMFEDIPFEYRMIPGWFREFVNLWFFTRIPRRIVIGLPCLMLGALAISMLVFGESDSDVGNHYESALAAAIENEQSEDTELIMARMLQANYGDDDLRFRLAQHLVTLGRIEDAQEHLDILAPPDLPGHAPARLWLVKQSQEPNASIPLDDAQRQQQLRRAVDEDGRNIEVHLMLAESYAKNKQWQLAEGHLAIAAELDPRYTAELVALQRRSGRQSDAVLEQAAQPVEKLTKQLDADPSDVQARTSLVRIRLAQGDLDDAERLLQAGLEIGDSTELKAMLSSTYTTMATRLLPNQMSLPRAAKFSLDAVVLDPTNETALNLLQQTSKSVNSFNQQDLASAIGYWKQEVAKDGESARARFRLAQLLAACGQYDEAADALEPAATTDSQLQLQLVQLYLKAGRQADADAVTDRLTAAIRERMQAAPEDAGLATSLAQILLMCGREDEANAVMEAQKKAGRESQTPEFSQVYTTAKLTVFDQKSAGDESFLATAEALGLLQDALNATPQAAAAVVPRLAQMTFMEGESADKADRMLTKILAEQNLNYSAYLSIGTLAVVHEDYDKAVKYLERARLLSPDDSQVLNNLAVALVRQSADNADRALKYSQRAIELAPGHVELVCSRAEIYLALKRWSDARADLEAVLKQQPNHELASTLLEQVEAESNSQASFTP
ncbi:tetratricopeptide repeat protein [Fuerstiella marisgermanici]|uniref:Tetratricopeptide repeat protein n=1 Tax=Fuerstiella marisgermanici TaxID=1891926 RepID=A0A1P8WKA8_9PLAN|nr:tetratricopeptide repeat protein [Fuerstiella marisgermanici]APZ94483.1 tetratricopeptide repeat protein [Fuerstiella marisgermanici]